MAIKEIREQKIMNSKALKLGNKVSWFKHSTFKGDPVALLQMIELLKSLEQQLQKGVSRIVEEQKERIKKK